MKKIKIILISALVLTTAAATQAIAGGRHENAIRPRGKAITAVHQYFPAASDVVLNENGNYVMAKFTLGHDPVRATFDSRGNLINSFRTVRESQLPMDVYLGLNSSYGTDKVTNVVECSDLDTHFYVITLESNTQWIKLKTDGDGGFITVQKFDKA